VMNQMRDSGILVGSTGRERNVLKIRPPLVLSTEQADRISETLDACLGALSAGPSGARAAGRA
jgi:4-aminobutyrate aminotransferase-like enzyme